MMSSIRLFGAMRPTNRKFASPSSEYGVEHRMSGRAASGARVDGDRQHAGVREAERLELLTVVVGIAEGQVRCRRRVMASSRRPSAASRKMPGS